MWQKVPERQHLSRRTKCGWNNFVWRCVCHQSKCVIFSLPMGNGIYIPLYIIIHHHLSCISYIDVCVYGLHTHMYMRKYTHISFRIYIILSGTDTCILLTPTDIKFSKGLSEGSRVSVLQINTCTSSFFVKENISSVILTAYNFRVFLAYAFSSSSYLSAYPSYCM